MALTRLLNQTEMTKPLLANALGVSRSAVYAWGEFPPRYVMAYLELLDLSQTNERIVFKLHQIIKLLEEK